MRKFTYLLSVLLLSTTLLQAQDVEEEGTPITISGSVDAYYRANLNSLNRRVSDETGRANVPGTSFANLPGFSLGMVNLIAGYEGENVGFVADLVFGPRGTEAVFEAVTASSSIVNQLYVYWNVSDAVTLTLGNFNTFLGYEVISPAGNFNYSTSYMFSYGPFSHTGLKADFALSDEFSLMLAVMNPTDFTDFNPVAAYTLGAQLGYATDASSVYLNLLYGDQDGNIDADRPALGSTSNGATFQADITAGFDLSEQLYFGLNTTINSTGAGEAIVNNDVVDVDGDAAGFFGLAGYLQYATSETFSLGFRGEYFSVTNNGVGAIVLDDDGDGNVIDLTLSGNVSVGNLTLIPELRVDLTSEDSFLDADLDPQSALASFMLAAVYSF